MKKFNPVYPLCALAAIALSLAACGGGGGGGNSTGGGSSALPVTPASSAPGTTSSPGAPSSPGASSSPGATSSPAPSATPMDFGSVSINGAAMANASVVFTCGCTGEGGMTHADASGNYLLTVPATAIPAQSSMYTPPGHNLVVVGYSTSNNAQAWTMIFLGNTAAKNLNLSNSPSNASANGTDTASTAAALYVFYEANYNPHITGSDRTFDWFNFNTVASYAAHLRSSPTAHETTLINDIVSEQAAGHSLYPGYVPAWNASSTAGVNALITSDIHAVALDSAGGTDAAAPTPCPAAGQCTGAPTP